MVATIGIVAPSAMDRTGVPDSTFTKTKSTISMQPAWQTLQSSIGEFVGDGVGKGSPRSITTDVNLGAPASFLAFSP